MGLLSLEETDSTGSCATIARHKRGDHVASQKEYWLDVVGIIDHIAGLSAIDLPTHSTLE